MAVHLTPSPKIESDDAQVHQAAKEAVGDRSGAWEKVEAIHRWVHEKIEFAGDMENVQTCTKTLQDRRGVCAEMNSLERGDVAGGRVSGAGWSASPAIATMKSTCLDAEGRGHWLAGDASRDATITPGQSIAGMILQKGDNVTIIDPKTKRRTKGRFLAETAVGLPQSSAAKLSLQVDQPGHEGHAARAPFPRIEDRGRGRAFSRPASGSGPSWSSRRSKS